ncbi:MAG TPA: cytochrome c [Vicinamibacterales bacterium]|nr:cytochrome c [Vicinamibacterales bacterium]
MRRAVRVPLLSTRVLLAAGLIAAAGWVPLARPLPFAGAPVAQENGSRRSTRDGVYTLAQAERGEKLYAARCAACHQTAQLSGPVFMRTWNGQSADALFDLIRTTMPQENPGSLKPQQYADLLAYIFRMNGLPPGEEELKGASRALRQVIIEAPKP